MPLISCGSHNPSIKTYLSLETGDRIVEKKATPSARVRLRSFLGLDDPLKNAFLRSTFEALGSFFSRMQEGEMLEISPNYWTHYSSLPPQYQKSLLPRIENVVQISSPEELQKAVGENYLRELGHRLHVSVEPLINYIQLGHLNAFSKAYVHHNVEPFFKWLLENSQDLNHGLYYIQCAFSLTQNQAFSIARNYEKRVFHPDSFLEITNHNTSIVPDVPLLYMHAYMGRRDLILAHDPSEEEKVKIFQYAALGGHTDLIESLSSLYNFNLNTVDERKTSLFHYAALGGHINLILFLFDGQIDAVPLTNSHEGILQFAAMGGHTGVAERCLKIMSYVRRYYTWFNTDYKVDFFHYAAMGGQYQLFCKKDAFKNFFAATNLDASLNGLHKYSFELSSYLQYALFHPQSPSSGFLNRALQGGHYGFVKHMLRLYHPRGSAETFPNFFPAHFAAFQGNVEQFEWFNRHYPAYTNITDNKGDTALDYALQGGNQKIAQLLISPRFGFDIHYVKNDGTTAVHQAVRWGRNNILKWLVEEKGLPIPLHPDPLLDAANRTLLDTFKLLLDFGVVPLHKPWIHCPNLEIRKKLKLLVKKALWPFPTELMHALPLAFELPLGIREIPNPPISWRSLQQFSEKCPQYKAGLLDLFERIDTRRVTPSAGGEGYYQRMEKYIGHLLSYVQSHEHEADEILSYLTERMGACGGILEDIEQIYLTKCTQTVSEDLQSALLHIGWQIRQNSLFDYLLTAPNSKDVHYSYGLRNAIAPAIGTLPPQEEDPLAKLDEAEMKECIEKVQDGYPILLVRTLMERIQNSNSHFTIGDGSELFDEALMLDMFSHKAYSKEFALELRDQIIHFKEEIKDPEKRHEWQEKLYIDVDDDYFHELDTDTLTHTLTTCEKEDDQANLIAIQKAFLYPLLRKYVKPEDLVDYLQKIQWLAPWT